MAKKSLYAKYLLFILIIYCFPSKAQAGDIYFYHLDARDGLSQVNIMSVYQDEFGAMWFGSTEGLNRYNGKEIEVFRPTKRIENGLSQNTIYSICGNKNGSVYLRAGADFVRYDISTQQFESVKTGGVTALAYEYDILWATVGNTIMQYNEEKRELERYAVIDEKIRGITSLYPAKDGSVWVGTARGLLSIPKDSTQEQRYKIEDVHVQKIYMDRSGNLWVGTQGQGIYVIGKNGDITVYKHKKGGNSLSNDDVRDFVEDNNGNMWIATFYGLNEFNPEKGTWSQYVSNDNVSHSISHNSIFALYKDNQGTIWAGTYFGGVNYFNPESDIFRYYGSSSTNQDYLSFPYVGKMTEDKYGNLWICTEGGALNCLNLKTRKLSRYMFSSGSLESVANYNQKTIWYREDKDLLYIGMHNGGLAIFDIKTKSARILTNNPNDPYSLPNNTINKIQYYDGSLYLLTQKGVSRMDLSTNKFYPVSNNPAIQKELSGLGLYTFLIDGEDRMWVLIHGVKSVNLKTGEVKVYTYDKNKDIGRLGVVDIFENRNGDIYFATLGSGIFKYNPGTDDFDNYTVENTGLSSNYCYNISEAPSGHLILLHNKKFSFIDPKDPGKRLFRSSNNFPLSAFNIGNSSYIARDKEIFIGGVNGLVSFYEKDLDKIYKDYNLYFDKLQINNRTVIPGDKSDILQKTLALCSEITLKYDQSNFSIGFATSDYLQTMTRNYEYKLSGFDSDWLPARTNMISYTNLNAGKYVLQIREVSPENNGKIYSLGIRIEPPFYLSTLAFFIYGILIFLIVVAIIRFYTWRTKLETTLEFERKDKERIEELNKTKLRFFTNVSHEFRTPLTLIIGQVETLLMQNDLSTKVYNKVSKIHKNTNHLLNLISELLDFRKQEQGFYKLNIKHVELIPYIKDIYESFQDYAAKRQIKYKMDYADENIYVYIDPVHLQKAIYNLLSNAFKYTSVGGEIRLNVRLQDSEVLIRVVDNGIGIPPESLHKIFERFYQLEYRSSGLTLGTGIGLALTKEIILSHKGTIDVESTLNEGSVFTIALKLGTSHFTEEELNYKEANNNMTPKVEMYVSEEEGEESLLVNEELAVNDEKPTVLIADDNESLLDMLTDVFSPSYNVYTATNGKVALEMIFKTQPDIVISDVMMPEMSGKELCYKIKNNVNTSHIPVVLLTAQISDDQIIDGYMFGADEYITKPFNVKVLIMRCNSLIKNRRLLYRKFTNQQDSSISFDTVLEHDQVLIDKAIKIIKDNFSNSDFDMNMLGTELGMGRSKLYAKIKEITGFTPNELTLNLKLQEAANMLDNQPQKNISDIAFEVGFSSTKYFSKCFKTFYGMVPQDWRKRNKEIK